MPFLLRQKIFVRRKNPGKQKSIRMISANSSPTHLLFSRSSSRPLIDFWYLFLVKNKSDTSRDLLFSARMRNFPLWKLKKTGFAALHPSHRLSAFRSERTLPTQNAEDRERYRYLHQGTRLEICFLHRRGMEVKENRFCCDGLVRK